MNLLQKDLYNTNIEQTAHCLLQRVINNVKWNLFK